MRDVTRRLFQHLLQVFPALLQQKDRFEKLKDDVVIPALKFAHLVEALPMKYGFGPAFYCSPVAKPQMVPFSWLREMVLKDVVTRKTLNAGNVMISIESGFIGELIMVLEPALERVAHGQIQKVQIRKAVAAVKLIAPVRKQNKYLALPKSNCFMTKLGHECRGHCILGLRRSCVVHWRIGEAI